MSHCGIAGLMIHPVVEKIAFECTCLSFGDTETNFHAIATNFFRCNCMKICFRVAWVPEHETKFEVISKSCLVCYECKSFVLICFESCKRIWLVKIKKCFKKSSQGVGTREFFYYSHLQQKHLAKKVAKQGDLTWGHTETFLCDCNKKSFLLQSHENCFRVPLP